MLFRSIRVKNIIHSQNELIKIKENLASIIDSLDQNPSLITRAANFWGKLPLWQKVLGAVLVVLPALIIGIVAHIAILLAVSAIAFLIYTVVSFLLADHHQYKVDHNRLKNVIFNLAEVLSSTLSALETLRLKLAEEIEKFNQENLKLTQTIENLDTQLFSLSEQVKLFTETEGSLRQTKEDLERQVNRLDKTIGEQKITLDEINVAFASNQNQLTEKIMELAQVKTELGLELEKAKKIATTLEGAVKALSGTVIEDPSQREIFQQKLDGFLNDKQASFDQVADRICTAEQELAVVKEQLKQTTECLEHIVEKHGHAVDIFMSEVIKRSQSHVTTPKSTRFTEALQKHGLYKSNDPATLCNPLIPQGRVSSPIITH